MIDQKNASALFQLAREISSRGYWWTQGAGGNVSFKTDDSLFIKPSGMRLDEMANKKVTAEFRLAGSLTELRSLAAARDEAGYSRFLDQGTVDSRYRPSMETGFHAGLSPKFVCHFHSLVSVLIAFQFARQPEKVKEWYQPFAKIWGIMEVVPLEMPGLELSEELILRPTAGIYFLANHGVVLTGDTPPSLDAFRDLEIDFLKKFGYATAVPLMQQTESSRQAGAVDPLFPDFVIVFPKLQSFLKENPSEKNQWILDTEKADLGVKELWWAHLELQALEPELPPLPNSFCEKLGNLPTELIRKQKMGV